MSRSKTSKVRIEALDRRIEAMNHRRAGLSYTEIGEKMGIDRTRAFQLVKDGMGRLKEELGQLVEETTQLQIERIEKMLAAVWPKAEQGDPKAIETVLRLMERQSRLLGLDAPTKTEAKLSVTGQLTDAELVAEAEKLGLTVPKELIRVEPVPPPALPYHPDLDRPHPADGGADTSGW